MQRINLDRLAEYGIDASTWADPWGCGFDPSMIAADNDLCLEQFCHINGFEDWSPEQHAARIRYLLATPWHMAYPIEVDCECSAGRVLALPVILDGWHRLHAHWHAGRKTIAATFGGRLDLWDYLRGESSEFVAE